MEVRCEKSDSPEVRGDSWWAVVAYCAVTVNRLPVLLILFGWETLL